MLHYTLTPLPHRHQWQVCLQFEHRQNNAQTLKLANWTPGSYMIRDFSRHIMHISAECNGRAVELRQTAKNVWLTPAQSGHYRICYTVYANDMSVRTAYLDTERGFISGACLFLYLPDRQTEIHRIEFDHLPEHWQTVTALPRLSDRIFQAACYAELIDCPIETGARIELLEFTACNIPHRIALSGVYPDFDRIRLLADCTKICTAAHQMFPAPAPFADYLFLLHLGHNIYGGLEHRNSTALHADRHSLPAHGTDIPNDAYTQLLGLIAHEYFHAWNVKSIKPAVFNPYDLDHEAYTEQLWAFEGITSYYDDLLLVRSGVIDTAAYLNLLAQNLTRVRQNGGRKLQTLAQSSFTAWDKYYKPDENSPNAVTSYYQHGALAALCLDLTIRTRSHGRHSLDTVMQALYRDWLSTGQGIPEQHWQSRAQTVTGLDLNDFFQAALYSTEPLPLESSLKTVGIELHWLPENRSDNGRLADTSPSSVPPAPDLGCRFKQHPDHAQLTHVLTDGAAEQAALMPGDTVIAVNGYACTNLARQAATHPGERHRIHYFRHGVLRETELTVQAAPPHTACLSISDRSLLTHWLSPSPTIRRPVADRHTKAA